jgi:hypothetical protein
MSGSEFDLLAHLRVCVPVKVSPARRLSLEPIPFSPSKVLRLRDDAREDPHIHSVGQCTLCVNDLLVREKERRLRAEVDEGRALEKAAMEARLRALADRDAQAREASAQRAEAYRRFLAGQIEARHRAQEEARRAEQARAREAEAEEAARLAAEARRREAERERARLSLREEQLRAVDAKQVQEHLARTRQLKRECDALLESTRRSQAVQESAVQAAKARVIEYAVTLQRQIEERRRRSITEDEREAVREPGPAVGYLTPTRSSLQKCVTCKRVERVPAAGANVR